jgi:hypothetical protein
VLLLLMAWGPVPAELRIRWGALRRSLRAIRIEMARLEAVYTSPGLLEWWGWHRWWLWLHLIHTSELPWLSL